MMECVICGQLIFSDYFEEDDDVICEECRRELEED